MSPEVSAQRTPTVSEKFQIWKITEKHDFGLYDPTVILACIRCRDARGLLSRCPWVDPAVEAVTRPVQRNMASAQAAIAIEDVEEEKASVDVKSIPFSAVAQLFDDLRCISSKKRKGTDEESVSKKTAEGGQIAAVLEDG